MDSSYRSSATGNENYRGSALALVQMMPGGQDRRQEYRLTHSRRSGDQDKAKQVERVVMFKGKWVPSKGRCIAFLFYTRYASVNENV